MTQVVTVELSRTVEPEDLESLARRLGQLSSTATFDPDLINEVLDHQATELLVDRLEGQIVGMATLVSIPLPTGLRGHVEDIVVNESQRYRLSAVVDDDAMADAQDMRTPGPCVSAIARVGAAALRICRLPTAGD